MGHIKKLPYWVKVNLISHNNQIQYESILLVLGDKKSKIWLIYTYKLLIIMLWSITNK